MDDRHGEEEEHCEKVVAGGDNKTRKRSRQ